MQCNQVCQTCGVKKEGVASRRELQMCTEWQEQEGTTTGGAEADLLKIEREIRRREKKKLTLDITRKEAIRKARSEETKQRHEQGWH